LSEGVRRILFFLPKEISLNRHQCKDHGAPEGMRSDLYQQVPFPEIHGKSLSLGT